MNTNNLDEDSFQIQINLIDSKNKETANLKQPLFGLPKKLLVSLLNNTKEYSVSLYEYCIDLWYLSRRNIVAYSKKASFLTTTAKSYTLSKMFWGRGSLYRYIAVLFILLPIGISVFLVNHYQTASITRNHLVITNAFINQTANNNTNQSSVEGKLIEANAAPVTTVIGSETNPISWYKVQQGDTLASIAKKFSISTDTIKWANKLSSNTVTPGEELEIITVQGIIYTVQKNDTLNSIAKSFDVDASQIAAWNLIDPSGTLTPGQTLFLAGASEQNTPQYVIAGLAHISSQPSVGCPTDDKFCFLQTDPRWADYVMGSGAYSPYSYINIGHAGCLITDVAMVAQYYALQGYQTSTLSRITPYSIASTPGYFVYGGLFTLSGLGYFNVSPLGGVFGGVNWTAINQHLAMGQPVIVYTGVSHYVLLYAYENGEYLMNDPAKGGELDFDKYYDRAYVSQAYLYTPKD